MYYYVIMPVGSDLNSSAKMEAVASLSERYSSKPHFPRYASQDPEFNLQATLQDMSGASFVLADLSLERPSCYYELGLAEALAKPVFLIANRGTEIHQTAARRSVRFYHDLDSFKSTILEILGDVEGTRDS